jgi:hypothetical protein
MRSLKDLDKDALTVALEASDALMQLKEFLPRSGLLLMLVSRFRDDTRESLGMEAERYPGRGQVFRSLDQLTTAELDTVSARSAPCSKTVSRQSWTIPSCRSCSPGSKTGCTTRRRSGRRSESRWRREPPKGQGTSVIPQQDGAKVVISGSKLGCGASGPHHGTEVRLSMREDGPLIRFLMNGHL